jgi:hypothetical protein
MTLEIVYLLLHSSPVTFGADWPLEFVTAQFQQL